MEKKKTSKTYPKILDHLKKKTHHEAVKLTNCGNAALFAAIYIAKQLKKTTILIPDQGGWISYKTYPSIFDLKIEEVDTDDGIIDLESLKELATKKTALIVSSFAGYFAEQPMKEISEICKKQGCLLIEDASGAIGDDVLCDGRLSEIIVASFGRGKPVNLNYGGFISVSNRDYLERVWDIFSLIDFEEMFYDELYEKLKDTERRLGKFFSISAMIKNDLKEFDIAQVDKRGINVVVRFKTEEEKNKIIAYCDKNKYEYTICPKYIRLDDKAVSIEVKRLEV
ncbi:MAG: DegT/DnrJ/EryC1/StrS family aminotransferase [Nanoarchaeota archaeon]|nr:DegT/DnrJ/EryC1/StrS family aminotransferase [Nanoarchaeota archaeon]